MEVIKENITDIFSNLLFSMVDLLITNFLAVKRINLSQHCNLSTNMKPLKLEEMQLNCNRY